MKTLLAFAVVAGLVSGTFADIQDPPSNDYGPTRKLGRGLSNFFIAPAEVFVTVTTINTYPFPTWRDSYYPMLPPDIPYIHAGYSEFPPELGNESKYPYVRDY